jgi:hypothetical protein
LARHYRREDSPADVRRVLGRYREAFILHVRRGPALTAAGQLRWVYDDLKKFGVTDGIEDLEKRLLDYGQLAQNELAQFSQKMTIPVADVEKWLEWVVPASLEEACERIGDWFIPKVEDAKAAVTEAVERAPLFARLPMARLTTDGRTEASVGGTESDEAGRIVHHIAQSLNWAAFWLDMAMGRLFAKFGQPDDLARLLLSRPLLDGCSPVTLASAVRAYMRQEYSLAASTLAPLIEGAVRRLGRSLDTSVMKTARGGGQHLRNLDELLTDEKVAGLLGPDVSTYLRTLLTDQRGWNLRNNICHGILQGDRIMASHVNRLLHVCLVLALFRPEPETGLQSETAPL